MNKFQIRLIEALHDSGYSQQELSQHLNVHKTVVNSWIVGKCKAPNDINKIIEISKYLNVNPAWLAGFDEPRQKFSLTSREKQLLEKYRQLSEANQQLIQTTVEALPVEIKMENKKLA